MLNGTERNLMGSKLSSLHEKYGMRIRFSPDGNEGEDPDAVAQAIKDAEAAEIKDNPEFDKVKQQAQQEAANAAKARERASQAESQVAAAASENEKLKEQLADAQAAAQKAGIKNVDLNLDDYEHDTDKNLVKAIKNIEEQLKLTSDENAKLAKKAKEYEAGEAAKIANSQKTVAYQDMLSDLDEEYGAENRNAALAMFNELRDQGKTPKGNPAKAGIVLARCYKKTKAAADKNPDKKAKVSGDPGYGGGTSVTLKGEEIKEGSLDEVSSQYKKAGATKTPEDY